MRVMESWTDYGRGWEDGTEKTIARVLEIIDTVNDDLDFGTKEKGVALLIKDKVLDFKGEQSGA